MEDVRIAKELASAVAEVPEPFRTEAFKVLLHYRLGLVTQLASAQQAPTTAQRPAAMQNFAEFYRSLSPEPVSNPQRFAAVAYHYREHQSQPRVTRAEIINTMQEAGLPPPKNFSRDIKSATGTRNALLMPSREKKDGELAWQPTKTGEDFIRERLSQS